MKKQYKRFCLAGGFLLAFMIWTVAVCLLDVQKIGPKDSEVGFASLNHFVHRLTGVHLTLYDLTDWLGLVPIGFAMGFGILGLFQWIARRKLKLVDHDLLVLGGFYIATMAAYILFEYVVVNYRPVLIQGYLEASYPSSTTLLVLCVMVTAILQLKDRIKPMWLQYTVCILIALFIGFMVIARLISGVHWFTDIVGGVLLSAGLVYLYCAFNND